MNINKLEQFQTDKQQFALIAELTALSGKVRAIGSQQHFYKKCINIGFKKQRKNRPLFILLKKNKPAGYLEKQQ